MEMSRKIEMGNMLIEKEKKKVEKNSVCYNEEIM